MPAVFVLVVFGVQTLRESPQTFVAMVAVVLAVVLAREPPGRPVPSR